MFINAILDAGKYQTIQARVHIGKLIIVMSMIFNFVTAVFMVICLGQALIDVYNDQKQKRVKKLEALRIQNRNEKLAKNNITQNLNLQKNNKIISEPSLIQEGITSKNNNDSEIISFQQEESFNLGLLQNKIQRANRSRKTFNPTRESQGLSSSVQSQESPSLKIGSNMINTSTKQGTGVHQK